MSNWKVRAGSDKLGNFPSLPVAKIFVTELNITYPKENDIALVKLQFPLTFSGEKWHLGTEPLRSGYTPTLPLGGLRLITSSLKTSAAHLFPANISA